MNHCPPRWVGLALGELIWSCKQASALRVSVPYPSTLLVSSGHHLLAHFVVNSRYPWHFSHSGWNTPYYTPLDPRENWCFFKKSQVLQCLFNIILTVRSMWYARVVIASKDTWSQLNWNAEFLQRSCVQIQMNVVKPISLLLKCCFRYSFAYPWFGLSCQTGSYESLAALGMVCWTLKTTKSTSKTERPINIM